MSPFHPAVRGILEAALTEHQQAANLARLAAGPGHEDAASRLDEIATGVQRVIDAITPDNYGHMPVEQLTDNKRAHALMGRLLTELADYDLRSWEKRYDSMVINLHPGYGGDRAAFRDIADRLVLEYASKPFSTSTDTDHVSATGVIDGFKVEFYALLPTETPTVCPVHGIALVDELCDSCENNVTATPALADDPGPMHCIHHSTPPIPPGSTCPECDPPTAEGDDVDELYIDEDAPVTHTSSARTGLARCGDPEEDPVFSNRPTCPTCRSLQRAKTPPVTTTGDAP